MAKSMYVLVSYNRSPIFFTTPKNVAIYESLKDAKEEANRRNGSPRTSLEYWVERVPLAKTEG